MAQRQLWEALSNQSPSIMFYPACLCHLCHCGVHQWLAIPPLFLHSQPKSVGCIRRHKCQGSSKCLVGACVAACGLVLSNLGTLAVPPLGASAQFRSRGTLSVIRPPVPPRTCHQHSPKTLFSWREYLVCINNCIHVLPMRKGHSVIDTFDFSCKSVHSRAPSSSRFGLGLVCYQVGSVGSFNIPLRTSNQYGSRISSVSPDS